MFKFPSLPGWYKRAAKSEEGVGEISAGNPDGYEVPETPAEHPADEPVTNEDGSLFKVPLTTIVNIEPHSNADRLELATVYGFQVIVQKGKYKPGDRIIYVPIDSLLPVWLETIIFPPDSKITLHHHRVRQIRIRKLASQGMIIDPSDVVTKIDTDFIELEHDLAAILEVTKYRPPSRQQGKPGQPGKKRNKPLENPRFHKYGGINNIKWFPTFFDGKEVVIQEKLHGSNCRASYAKTSANTFWKKIKKFFGKLPAYEYCYGSNNVQLQERSNYSGFYDGDVYGDVLKKVDAFNKMRPGETIYGELIGPGIQKNYDYGLTEHHFVLFDVKVELPDGSQEYLDPEQVEAYAKERGFDFVPVLYRGIFNPVYAKECSMGKSVYSAKQKIREGVVIKARTEYGKDSHKRALKLISEDYLNDDSNTDFQ
jgi:RNA ligase (TIGR02306 family)